MMHRYTSMTCGFFLLSSLLFQGYRTSNWAEPDSFSDQWELATWMDSYQSTIDQAKQYLKATYPNLQCIPREWVCVQLATSSWYTYTLETKESGGCIQTIYLIDSTGLTDPQDLEITPERDDFTTAIQTATDIMFTQNADPRIHFVPFVRRNEDNTISVWMLPGQDDGEDSLVYYGPEYHYVLNAAGNHMVDQEVINQDLVWGVPLNRGQEIWLNYQDEEEVTTGAMYFAWRYRNHFKRVYIETKKHITAIQYYPDGTYNFSQMTKKHRGDKYTCFDPTRRG
ncbi:MAG: hypothetical protein R2806_16380 [Saprospiraceae bacterium]